MTLALIFSESESKNLRLAEEKFPGILKKNAPEITLAEIRFLAATIYGKGFVYESGVRKIVTTLNDFC